MNVTNSLQEEATQHHHINSNSAVAAENDEEPIVTSTSNDLSQSSPAHVQQQQQQQLEQNIDTTITSPARITSSTGNDCSISPPLRQQQVQQQQQQNNRRQYKIDLTVDGSSEDDSRSQHDFSRLILEQQQQQQKQQQQQQHILNVGDSLMPTTSSVAAAAAAANNLRPNSTIINSKLASNSAVAESPAASSDMVARNLLTPAIADSGGCGNAVVENALPAVTENHKLILKLPRPSAATTTTESQMDVDPTTSNSSTNSSNNSSTLEDTRKVEPLKINLHPTHSTVQQQHQHVVPKITIKPIIKKKTEETDASCSSADDDPPIPKLTIKAIATTAQHSSSSTEPHIVPKLTIRSTSGEEGSGTAQIATIVPRLTIKMSDSTQSASTTTHNSLLSATSSCSAAANLLKSPSSSVCSSPSPPQQPALDQVPLPKLTIKTSLDGTSNSIISHISPASLSSSSTSSTSSSSAYHATSTATASIPKLTIKNIPKPDDLVVPKLTIKTNAAGNSECATTTTTSTTTTVSGDPLEDATSSKIPKLTIKTGQEHAVIITQHTDVAHAQSIPKLTIKTKSLEVVDVSASPLSSQDDQNAEPPPEKIPKITIKTNEALDATTDAPKFCIKSTQSTETPTQSTIPKLTITVSNVDCGGGVVSATSSVGSSSGPQSPLVVRQLPGPSRKATATSSSSPERVPKLMISRQDSTSLNPILVVSNHSSDAASSTENKVVPKLTIKTNSIMEAGGESKESKSAKFSIKTSTALIMEEEKVPKLTIKTMPAMKAPSSSAMQQSSEDSDECVSLSSCSSPVRAEELNPNNKIVPKLTIKNLSSPQPTVKTAENTNMDASLMMTASKKCAKNSAPKNEISVTAKENPESPENLENPSQQLMTINDAEETIDEAFATVTELTLIDVPPMTTTTTMTTATTTNGGESSSSQEFCGFNDNTTDSQIEAASIAANLLSSDSLEEEQRRHSDDMDIDDALQQQHAPQIFNNVSHFSSSNGDGSCALEAGSSGEQPTAESIPDYLLEPLKHPKLTHFIDTVDLTSSPSPGSSPAHFNYADTDPPETEPPPKENDYLLDCLQQQHEQQQQRETSVIQQATTKSHSILLEQLTNHLNDLPAINDPAVSLPPPPLQPKPANCILNNSAKYPHLAERLMANGIIHMPPTTVKAKPPQQENVIMESIEILDTPEGSPRSSLDEEPPKLSVQHDRCNIYNNSTETSTTQRADNCKELLSHNNNNNSLLRANHVNLKRHVVNTSTTIVEEANILQQDSLQISPNKLRRIENDSSTMATITILTNDHQEPTTTVITTSPTMIQSNHCHEISLAREKAPSPLQIKTTPQPQQPMQTPQHRSRKQKHENLLSEPIEEEDLDQNPLQLKCTTEAATVECPSNTSYFDGNASQTAATAAEAVTPVIVKRRGRPRKYPLVGTPTTGQEQQPTPIEKDKAVKSRLTRVQMLRKRLAIDMVATEQPPTVLDGQLANVDATEMEPRLEAALAAGGERALRTPLRISRRSATPNTLLESKGKLASDAPRKQQRNKSFTEASTVNDNHQHFGVCSNSSLSSACSTSSLSSTTTAVAVAMAAQIDLTMSSSSSSNGSTTVTTVEAGGSRIANNSMLPPTTILSSSDPLVDVVFRPNDFSSLVAAQQLRSPNKSRRSSAEEANLMLTPTRALSRKGSRTDSQDEDLVGTCGSGADNSGDDSASSSSTNTPGRGRGRGRGRSSGRGSSGGTRGTRGARLGRGASAVAKTIAMNRPRCVGGLKHMPDPERLKGLFSPAPQVFEEDTRMSADLNQTIQSMELTQSASRQLDFLTNDESQSSVISNISILDPNTVVTLQNGAQLQKRPKKKKMEVCVAEDTEFTVASIAEYDWPPPKGCCPSKNRDTFMIQEQVALYLGIKSFKRKYPELPRRQVDMEERNWLQEKGLVSEKMCDLGITAVWASDILDIMYTDFYEKYEEYKDFMRQKHVREIESKQKALGLNVSGRGLQARDRAMLSASKWNAYFNKSRKEERNTCLDLQTLTVNVPLPGDAPIAPLQPQDTDTADTVEKDATMTSFVEHQPSLLKYMFGSNSPLLPSGKSYPLALVPGQYCEKFRHYTALELRSYPINTVLDDPRTLHTRLNRVLSRSQATSDTDTESATETTIDTRASQTNDAAFTLPSNKQRVPVRRSRRARTNATHNMAAGKTKCDTKNEQENNNDDGSSSGDQNSDYSTSSSSESTTISSETDSDSDSCSSSANEEESLATCDVCQRTQYRNLKNLPEVFIKCYTCRRKVHPSCVEMPHRMVARVRNYNWQCADCKCCIKCKRKQDQNKMLFCEQCDRGFHIYCMDIKTVPDGRWSCERCSICMRCGAIKPEGLLHSQNVFTTAGGVQQPQVKQIKHKKVKWINEYRIDHITKLREHCSMLCVPCGRAKTTNKRYNQHTGGSSGSVGVVLSTVNSQMSPPPAPCSSNSNTIA